MLFLLTWGHGIFSIYRSSTNAANSARHSMKVSVFLASILVVVSHQCLCRVCYYRSAVHGTGEWAVFWDIVSEYMYILCIYVTFCASVHSRCAFCVCWKAVFCVKNRRVLVEPFKGQVNVCWLCTKVGEVELSCIFVQPVLCFSLIKYSAGLHTHMWNHAHVHTIFFSFSQEHHAPKFLCNSSQLEEIVKRSDAVYHTSFWMAIWAQMQHCS